MIKRLVLNNLVLIDACEVIFGPSFNTITGETGAGKTALTEAIHLCLGGRADSELIRKGYDRAHVELYFSLESLPLIKRKLEEAGLETDEEEIVIRRELSKEGKNRAFINCKATPLPLLQEIGSELIDLIGQHSHQALRSSDSQRRLLDLFADLDPELTRFQESYREEKKKERKVEELQALCLAKDKNEAIWRFQWEELDKAQLKEEEEEALFAQYEKISHSRELAEKMVSMTTLLSEGPSALVPNLNKLIRINESILSYDPSLHTIASLLKEALIPLKEAQRALESNREQELPNPHYLTQIEERLSLIAQLKRKYGGTLKEIETFKKQLEKQLEDLSTLSDDLLIAKNSLQEAQKRTGELAQILTEKRIKAARLLQTLLSEQLQELNMKGAKVEIAILPCQRTPSGDDLIQFWLQANSGENPGLVKEHASGGEVARLLFAIKIALAEKNNTPTLIFDEIDANVGGKTATLIGKKLKELGLHKQVICITHFPQVASQANTHFQVQKIEIDGRTITRIECLDAKQTQHELIRMGGG